MFSDIPGESPANRKSHSETGVQLLSLLRDLPQYACFGLEGFDWCAWPKPTLPILGVRLTASDRRASHDVARFEDLCVVFRYSGGANPCYALSQ
jgi:hypothetical protein